MKQLTFLLCLISSSLFGQTFQNGFNFYLPPYDSTSQLFLPDFPIEPIGPNDFVNVTADGNFAVNGKQLRIYGNNIWMEPGLYPDKDKAALIAGRLRKFGYNMIRFESLLNDMWGLKKLGGPNIQYYEDRLDKFFYFVNELKKQGIRISFGWNFAIRHTAEEGIPAQDSIPDHGICDYYNRQLIDARKNIFKDFISRINPYTGLAMKDDPVLGIVDIVTEDWFFMDFSNNSLKPIKEGGTLPTYYSTELDNLWNKYLLNKYGNDEALEAAWLTGGALTTNVLQDTSFENSIPNHYWKLMVLDAANADLTFINNDGVSGNKCCKVTINNSTGIDWHVRVYQDVYNVIKDSTYTIKFWAKADQNRTIIAVMQKLNSPYTIYGSKVFTISSEWEEYSFTSTPSETNNTDACLLFNLGAQSSSVYFDNVTLSKYSAVDLLAGESLTAQNIKRFQKDELKQFVSLRKTDEVAFYIDIQEKYFDEFYSFMRNDCNIKIPISGQNGLFGSPDNKIQSRLDYIDTHLFWKLPSADKTGEMLYENKSMLKEPENSTIAREYLRGIAFKNKPLSTGSYGHSYYTDYYAETPFYITAYSSLHDADAVMYFCYGSDTQMDEDVVTNNMLDFTKNNILMAFMPSFAKAFRDKLISTSTQPVELKMTNNDLLSSPFTSTEGTPYPPGYPDILGLIHKIDVSDYNSTTPFSENIIPAVPTNPYTSDTKQLVWDKNGLFTINAPKFIAAVGFLQDYPNKGIGNVKMISGNTFGGFTWISLTDDNLNVATKSLLTIGTKQENTNTVWNADKSRVLNIGTAPTIIEPAKLSFELTIQADSIRVHQLGTLGERTGKLKVCKPITANKFRVDIDQSIEKTLWYGIETKWTNEVIRTISLLQPNGGQKLGTGTAFKINWESVNVEHLSIWFSTNGGTDWNLVAANVDASLKEYNWTVPEMESPNCLIKISANEDAAINDFSDETFLTYDFLEDNLLINGNFSLGMNNWGFYTNEGTQSSANVVDRVLTVDVTNGGTVGWYVQLTQSALKIEKGKTYDISFDASAGQARNITVGVGQDGGSYTSYFSQYVSLTTGMKNYAYRFTMTNTTDNNARFGIEFGGENNSVNLDNIILREHKIAKTIVVTSPKNSDVWKINRSYDITWTSTDINKMNIYYKLANQSSWIAIASNIAATLGKYSWTVPASLSDSCQIKLEDAESTTVNARSPNFFIQLPSIELTSPKLNDILVVNKSYDIIWTSSDVNKVNLYYKLGNAASWVKFGNSLTAGTGRYSWTVPVITSDSCQIKIENAEITSINSVSQNFYIAVPSIEIISPKDGEILHPGENFEIEWTSQFVDNLNLYYKTWNTSAWNKLGDNVDASILNYSWTVPDLTFDSCQIKAEDSQDAQINAISPKFYVKNLTDVIEMTNLSNDLMLLIYPNPFIEVTTLKYSIPFALSYQKEEGVMVTLKVYNAYGAEVTTLVNEPETAGNYHVQFEGSKYPGGIYLCKLTVGGNYQAKKLILLK